mmetsp:Transcript_79265/g.181626  ORF Transcript_79265/g.181626 Transcript_79265/m.181626 type:complete len:99 (+) Transcript_79265:1688-1984(+)
MPESDLLRRKQVVVDACNTKSFGEYMKSHDIYGNPKYTVDPEQFKREEQATLVAHRKILCKSVGALPSSTDVMERCRVRAETGSVHEFLARLNHSADG